MKAPGLPPLTPTHSTGRCQGECLSGPKKVKHIDQPIKAIILMGCLGVFSECLFCFVFYIQWYKEDFLEKGGVSMPRKFYSAFNTVFVPLLLLAAGVGFPAACF